MNPLTPGQLTSLSARCAKLDLVMVEVHVGAATLRRSTRETTPGRLPVTPGSSGHPAVGDARAPAPLSKASPMPRGAAAAAVAILTASMSPSVLMALAVCARNLARGCNHTDLPRGALFPPPLDGSP